MVAALKVVETRVKVEREVMRVVALMAKVAVVAAALVMAAAVLMAVAMVETVEARQVEMMVAEGMVEGTAVERVVDCRAAEEREAAMKAGRTEAAMAEDEEVVAMAREARVMEAAELQGLAEGEGSAQATVLARVGEATDLVTARGEAAVDWARVSAVVAALVAMMVVWQAA